MKNQNTYEIARVGLDRRLREVAATLAQGLLRARAKGITPTLSGGAESQFSLGFTGDQRVHANPSRQEGVSA